MMSLLVFIIRWLDTYRILYPQIVSLNATPALLEHRVSNAEVHNIHYHRVANFLTLENSNSPREYNSATTRPSQQTSRTTLPSFPPTHTPGSQSSIISPISHQNTFRQSQWAIEGQDTSWMIKVSQRKYQRRDTAPSLGSWPSTTLYSCLYCLPQEPVIGQTLLMALKDPGGPIWVPGILYSSPCYYIIVAWDLIRGGTLWSWTKQSLAMS